jgi:hypothetical protein
MTTMWDSGSKDENESFVFFQKHDWINRENLHTSPLKSSVFRASLSDALTSPLHIFTLAVAP